MWSPERNFNVSTKENIEVPSTPSHGKWYGPRTPQTERRSSSPRESPRLSLTMFATTPRISFGKVKIGCSKVKRVVIENPLSIAQSLHLDKWPESKGFTILQPVEHGEAFQNSVLERSVEFIIPGMSEMDLPIMWKPNAEGSYRELVTLYLGDFNRLNLIVFGYAVDMAAKPVKPKMKTMLPEDIRKGAAFSSQKRKISKMDKQSTSSMKSKRILRESNAGLPEPKSSLALGNSAATVVKPIIKSESKLKGKHNTSRKFKAKVASKGVAPSRLRLTKHLTTERSLPRHPLPYAAKNMYYDEKWMEKQERGFVQWLNYVLTPPDELTTEVQSTSSCIFSNHETTGRQQHLAPTREVLSLRAYTAKRKMARLRRSACLLYQSQPVAFVAKTVEGEVEKNRLSIRADKHFHQDLGIKETMVKMLLSYNTLWLRIGLETIYGEVLPLQSNNDFVGLKRFLKKRFLANPDICKEYRHATVAEAYRPGYYEALKKFTLKKFLLLILFLDKAKLTRLIDHDPCLFNKDAGFKSSRLLLLTFSRDYLKGEGDVTKHLGLLNYTVTHEQAPLDEMDYAVTNLAVDLRDGLRVTRVIELLTQNWRLSANLRVPAISRLQKIHNVDVALNALKEKGVLSEEELNSVNPRHIVDGHREKTLSLLWMIILHFQVNQVVNEQQIKDEIAFLKKYYIQRKPHFKEAIVEHKDDVYCKSEKLSLLLEWCRSVCRLFGVKVDNFTVSMSDGRVMCYLLHYYHPCLLREEEICQETTQTCNPYTTEEDSIDDDSLNANDDSMALDQDESSPKLSQLKDNERRNHELLREKVKELGGVPSMLRFTDLSCTIPDEKVIITYTSYLCARLLDLRLEGRAARIVQLAWRKYREEKQAKEIKRMNRAASVIQKCVRRFLEKQRQQIILRSTIIIQTYVRGYQARRDLLHRQHAAAVIQSYYRSYRITQETRHEFTNLKRATLRVQSLYRGKIARRHVWRIKAARVIQSHLRGYMARRELLARKQAAVVLEAEVRKFLAKRRYQRLKTASVVIQRRYRAKLLTVETRRDFLNLKQVVTSLQAICRGNFTRREVKRLKAAIVIQKSVKMWRCRQEFLRSKNLITKLQAKVRRDIAKKRYLELVCAAVVIQRRWKAYRQGVVERKAYCQLKTNAVVIQSYYRKHVACEQYLARKKAVILTQACVRGFIVRKEMKRRENACCVIQRYFRAYLLMKKTAEDYKKMKKAAIYLQALWRGRTTRLQFKQQKAAIVSAQARIRGCLTRKRYLRRKSAVITLQVRYRAMKQMRNQCQAYLTTRSAIITLQAALRGHRVRQELKRMTTAATRIQASYRCYSARARHLHLKHCVFIIQQHYRAWSLGRQVAFEYRRTRDAVVVIQKYTRGMAVRKEVSRMTIAATRIQAAYRCYSGRARHLHLKHCVYIIQQQYRAWSLGRQVALEYRRTRDAVVVIQKYTRGMAVRKEVSRMTIAATRIQAAYRCYSARARHLHLKHCVFIVQQQYRAWSLGRQVALEYRRTRDAVVVIQKYARGMAVRKEVSRMTQAAVKIQANVKRYRQQKAYSALRVVALNIQNRFRATRISRATREDYLLKRQCVIRLQSALRRAICVKQYHRQKQAAMVLQTRWRAVLCSRKAREEYHCIRGSVITIQAFARGFRARTEVKRERAAIKIQSRWRGMVQKNSYQKTRCATIKLQARFRMLVSKRKYENLKNTVVHLQRLVRANQLCRRQTKIYQTTRDAVITLQAAVRGYRVRKELEVMNKAATRIQASFRRYFIRQQYLKIHRSALVIQRQRRATMLCRQIKTEYQSLRYSVLYLQSQVRGFIARKYFQESRRRIVLLQSAVRRIQARNNYLRKREAALTIQEHYRAYAQGCTVRKLYHLQRGACITVQANIRAWICRRRYEQLRKAAKIIQVHYRATVCAKEQRHEYLEIHRAVVTIQSFTRGWFARREVWEYRAATCIQSWWRMCVARERYTHQRRCIIRLQSLVCMWACRRRYLVLQEAAVRVQTRFRANVLCRKERDLFLEMKGSCFMIQHCYRFYRQHRLVRKMLESVSTLRNAALLLQRRFRANQLAESIRQQYLHLKSSTILLQAAYRGYQARVQVARFRAAIVIQSYYRGYQRRSEYASLKVVTIKIQALTRGKQTCHKYKKLRAAAVVVQRRQRACTQGLLQRRIFLTQKSSAVVIQSFYRGYTERTRYQKLRQAVIKVQSLVRGSIARKAYLQLRKAAIVIQTRERARTLGLIQRSSFLVLKKYTVLLQSRFRGKRERTRFLEKKNAVVQLQALARGKRERIAFARTRKAAIILQCRERARIIGKIQRGTFLKQRRGIVLIQSIVRSQQQRTRYLELRHAVITMQAHVRGKATRNHFEKLRAAAIVLQRRERARVIGKQKRGEYLQKRKSVIFIQSLVRGHQQRTRYCKLRHATIVIQARIRQKHARDSYQSMRAAAIIIQRRERGRVLGKLQKEEFHQQRRSAVLIQSVTRSYQQRTRYLQLKHAATIVQAHVRGKRAYYAYEKLRKATVVIQRRERARMLGMIERELFLTKRRCAILIQSWVRGTRERREYRRLRSATTTIQAFVRGYQQRKKYSEMKLAALCIQRRYRAYTLGREVLCRYHVIKNAIVIIQSHFRGHSARQFVKRIQASIIIQAAYRRYTAKRRYLSLRKATVYVQSLQRMKWEQRQYRELRNTTITLQRRAKANQLGREAKAEYLETRRKIIHLQALWRGLKARENVRRIKSARVIQRRYRACLEGRRVRAQFVLIRKAVITMQACYRGNVARQQFKRARAARTIQAYVRGCQARVFVKRLQAEKAARLLRFSAATYVSLMVVRLQRSYRKARAIALFKAKMDRLIFLQRWWRAKLQRLSYLRTRHLVCLVQRQWRARLAVKHQSAAKIQAVVRSFLAKRTAERRKEAILIIQCAWRGHSVRKRFNTAKFKKVRQRILVANSNVTEPMKLCNRTRSALDYLLKCKNLTTVREAFVHLEVATRLSHKCTEQLVLDNALCVIFKVVRESNRSLAHMGLIKLALDIFVNVSKCPTTKDAVVTEEPNSLDTLVELACIFREKHEIFLKVTKLLTILCGNENIRKSLLSMEKAVNKIKSIFTLTKRKHDFEMKRNTAKAKRLSVTTHNKKKSDSNSTVNPLAAVTNLVATLGLIL